MTKNMSIKVSLISAGVVALYSAAPVMAETSLKELPKQTISFALATISGIPICIVRKPIHEEKCALNYLSKDKPLKAAIPAGVFYFPFAVISGVLEAPFSSAKNSLLNFDKPFSKEQFSLGEDRLSAKEDPSQNAE